MKAAATNKIVLKELYDSLDSAKVPPKDLVGQANVRDASKYRQDLLVKGDRESIPTDIAPRGTEEGTGINTGTTTGGGRTEEDDAPVLKPPVKPEPAAPKAPVSMGVVNGKAVNLTIPTYPAAARAIRASGEVNVQVLIDETGKVVSAKAATGHPTLRSAAVNAALSSRFSPTYLSKQAVKVTGIIIYKFNP